MSKNNGSKKNVRKPANGETPGLSRRSFLKASVAGAGALALFPLNPAVVRGQGGSGSNTGAVQEEWVEPWEWRVSDYGPDDYLQLNVVEHQAPALVTGGLPLPLFSYNGMAPGPTIRMGGDEVLRLQLINQLRGNNGNWANANGSRFVTAGKNPDGTQHEANDPVPAVPDWQLSDLLYGPHQQHTTNLHTHGLHVSPLPNPDGSESDNVLLRIIPQEDFVNRQSTKINWPLKPGREIRKETRFEYRLGKSSGPDVETHPPGTHWYHPHPHGATYDQVASGMAGFLIVEGDVDDMLKEQIQGYKERLMLFQRVVAPPAQEGEEKVGGKQVKQSFPTVNGRAAGQLVIVMRPGAIERWRVLNGSVDGQGYIEFVVVQGDAPPVDPLPADATNAQKAAHLEQLEEQNAYLDDNKLEIDQLAFDGITLVTPAGEYDTMRVESLILAPANRADFLFQAPDLPQGRDSAVYTIWAKWVAEVSDTTGEPMPENAKIATLVVQGTEFDPGVTRNPQTGKLNLDFPPVPNLITPIEDEEITVPDGTYDGRWRTRRLVYSGWGAASYPCSDKINSMMIDGHKFDSAIVAHTMGLGTAEEWTLENYSLTIFEDANGTIHYGETVSHGTLTSAKQVFAKAADHPFHMHQNPFYVLSIVDANGNELLPGGQPRWQDVVRIPRNGGRVVFRSRFWDYPGEFVNHCHLLQHEDWGMMQTVAVVSSEADADYTPQPSGYQYPPPSLEEMFEASMGSSSLPPTCSDPEPPPPSS